jgi:flagellar biosynthesis protein
MKTDTPQPYTTAVAMHWDGTGAPRVTAKGRGYLADEIIALAEQHHVPLREEPALVDLLIRVDLGAQIPPSLYVAVAEVIAFAYSIAGKVPPHRKV